MGMAENAKVFALQWIWAVFGVADTGGKYETHCSDTVEAWRKMRQWPKTRESTGVLWSETIRPCRVAMIGKKAAC